MLTPVLPPLPNTFRIGATPSLYQRRVLRSTAISANPTCFEPRRRITFGMRDDRQRRAGATGVEMVAGKSMVDARPAPLQTPHDLDTSINAALDFPASNEG
ncbi:uncharacterized protein ARMOST_11547 [Armillaria ostoyae]|uniref:Uncharacterized protein n=1 Tax=Armillaria ostoyae TaxID=47428 RepID=A0A284RHE7_ARMOS|nr:uncharacterized protein ARMOST_11547 [Armillaria ostoyae]